MNRYGLKKSEYLRCDICAALLGAALLALFLYCARLGVASNDEAYYYTVPQRILNGDRLLVDEWGMTQLAYFPALLPYYLYTKITGGTAGIILFMRLVFVCVDMLFYAFMYIKLRRWKWSGLISAFLFCAVVPQTIFALTYYTVAAMAFSAAALILIPADKPKSVPTLALCGVITALGILEEPLLIIVYIIYIAAVAAASLKKRNAARCGRHPVFEFRTLLFISLGAFIVFVVFVLYLLLSGSLSGLRITLPYLFTGREMNRGNFIDPAKLSQLIRYFGYVPFGLICLCFGGSLAFCLLRRRSEIIRSALFALSCAAVGGAYINALFVSGAGKIFSFIAFFPAPLLAASAVWLLLCRGRTDKMRELSMIVVLGVLYSVIVDVSSSFVIGTGGMIAQIAGVYCFSVLFSASVQTVKTKKETLRKGVAVSAVALSSLFLCCSILWHAAFICLETVYKPVEKFFSLGGGSVELNCRLTDGPYKNLYTTEHISVVYGDMLEDLDQIRQNSQGLPMAVMELNPFLYLYPDLPCGAYSAWYQDPHERSALYWRVLPERRPGFIYIPYSGNYFFTPPGSARSLPEDVKAVLNGICSYTCGRGKAGFIIKVESWI